MAGLWEARSLPPETRDEEIGEIRKPFTKKFCTATILSAIISLKLTLGKF